MFVYNLLGQKLVELVNSEKPVGHHTINFDASNLSSGVYFYSLQAGQFINVKKMILLE